MKIKPALLLMFTLMIGCKSTHHGNAGIAERKISPTITDLQKQQLADGIDFYAKGNSPASWSLEMDWGNAIRFRSIDGTEANSTTVQGIRLADDGGTRYTTSCTYGDLVIEVQDSACPVTGSGEASGKNVTVTLDNKRYEGCGTYLFDPRLDGSWKVVKIDHQELAVKDFAKGLPQISIDVTAQKAGGNDGCNNFNSRIAIQGSKIKFHEIISTKMACPGYKSTTGLLQKLEGHFSGYSFTDDQMLILYLYDDSTLYLVKM